MKRKVVIIALACLFLFGAFWAWPAFHEPAHQPCTGSDEGSWSYKVGSRKWDCTSQGWHIGRYGFGGI